MKRSYLIYYGALHLVFFLTDILLQILSPRCGLTVRCRAPLIFVESKPLIREKVQRTEILKSIRSTNPWQNILRSYVFERKAGTNLCVSRINNSTRKKDLSLIVGSRINLFINTTFEYDE